MTFFNKLKWIIGILMIFILILGTNLIDRRNFIKVKESLKSIYSDRLAASEALFGVSHELHSLKAVLILTDSTDHQTNVTTRINTLHQNIEKFSKTRLVKNEEHMLFELNEHLTKIKKEVSETHPLNTELIIDEINKMLIDTKQLNNLQLSEGEKQLTKGERAIQTIEFFTQIEVYVMIILAIIVLVIIIYQPKKTVYEED